MTIQRQMKIEANISSYCSNMRKRTKPSGDAIDDWKEDLEWFSAYVTHFFRTHPMRLR